jgi:hypothetical protein
LHLGGPDFLSGSARLKSCPDTKPRADAREMSPLDRHE